MNVSFDTLTAARDLEAAGLERPQAEAIVKTMRESGRADFANLAPKVEHCRDSHCNRQPRNSPSPVDRRNNTHDSRSDRRHRSAFDDVIAKRRSFALRRFAPFPS